MHKLEIIRKNTREASLDLRRVAAAKIVQRALPFEFEDTNNNLDRLENLIYRGYGMIYCVPHFSTSDFLRSIAAFLIHSKMSRKGPILAPLAIQYVDNQVLSMFQNLTDIDLQGIVTKSTIKYEEELLKAGREIPWERQDLGYGTGEYSVRAVDVLAHNGSVYVAPQTERQEMLYPFDKSTIGLLDANLKRHKIEKVAYAVLGIKMQGSEDYSQGGLNISETYKISLADVLTSAELNTQAPVHRKRRLVDNVIYSKMYHAAPMAYRPEL